MSATNKKFIVTFAVVIMVAVIIFGISWVIYLHKAHSTFENYYAFRGCQKLLIKTADYGTCQLTSGTAIKIVKYQDKWYLDGDLPWLCWGKICFGM